MKMLDYFNEQQINRFYGNIQKYKTPFILCNLDIIKRNYYQIVDNMDVKVYYAVKANPQKQVILLLKQLGSNFDIASRYQLDKVIGYGIDVQRISYGNTIKKVQDIKYFYQSGVRLYVTDSIQDVGNIVKYAPESRVFCRMLIDSEIGGAQWPLSMKFGCEREMVKQIFRVAKQGGLQTYGISFHVGSQQRKQQAWYLALLQVKKVFQQLEEQGIKLSMINIGGGIPINYQNCVNGTEYYLQKIKGYLDQIFGKQRDIQILIQPGRSMVGNSGITVTQVINVTNKVDGGQKWLFTDAGVFNGFIQTLEQSIKYPCFIYKKQEYQNGQEYIIAGPTCDSMDILYRKNKIQLSNECRSGDKMIWCSTGAYTKSYASIQFNGFPSIPLYFV